jgi:hypothetical protein
MNPSPLPPAIDRLTDLLVEVIVREINEGKICRLPANASPPAKRKRVARRGGSMERPS